MLEHFRPTNLQATALSAFNFKETQFMTLRNLACFSQRPQGLEDYWQLSWRLANFSKDSVSLVIGFQASGS